MPQIEEYNSQVGAQGPVGGLDPRVEAAGAVGRGIEKLGQTITSAEDMLYKRKEQAETSDIYAQAASMRVDYHDKIQKGLQDGNLDTEKLKSEFQDEISNYSQNISTSGGQDYLHRQAARLQGEITRKAVIGQSHIAGIQAAQDLQSGMNSDSNALMSDPTQFQDIVDASQERTDAMIKAGSVNPGQAEKLNQTFEQEYAKAAVRGYANLNPDFAKKKLDDGEFDDYFNSDVKKQMYAEVKQYSHAKEIDNKDTQKKLDDEAQAKTEAWKQDALGKMIKGNLTANDILKAKDTLSFADQKEMLAMKDAMTRQEYKSDPRTMNQITNKILLQDGDPQKITDMSQLRPYLEKGQITPRDVTFLNGMIAKTPEGQAANANRKNLFDYAKADLVKKDSMTGMADPQGEANLARFTVDLHGKEADLRKQGLPISDLYNPRSKDYFGNNLTQYKKTQQQVIQDMANQARGIRSAPPTVNSQGVTLPNQPTATQTPGTARLQGETAQAYLARKKAGGK